MQVRVTGRHIDVTPPLRAHIERRLDKLEHIFHNLLDAHVIVFLERDDHVTDITVTGNHLTLHIRERDTDMYVAVDRAVHRLERQVRKHKDRVSRRKKTGLTHADRDLQAAVVAEQEWAGEPGEPEWNEEDAPLEEVTPVRVAAEELRTSSPAGPMPLKTAIETFLANGRSFFAFINAQSGGVEVLYRGPDGEVALITRA